MFPQNRGVCSFYSEIDKKTCRPNISPGISDETEYFAATMPCFAMVQGFAQRNYEIIMKTVTFHNAAKSIISSDAQS